MIKKILSDGSVEGETFSGLNYKGEFPRPKIGEESFRDYRKRVDQCIKEGFHLGDLSWDDWGTYCMGSGSYEGVNSGWIMGNDNSNDY
jgi:hypothetical protein